MPGNNDCENKVSKQPKILQQKKINKMGVGIKSKTKDS